MANQTINNETENKNLLLTKYLRKFRPFVSFQRWIATTSLIPNFLKYVFVSSKFKKHTTNDVTVKPILDENFLIFINSLHNNYHKQLLRKDSENRLIKDYFKAIDLFYSTRQF